MKLDKIQIAEIIGVVAVCGVAGYIMYTNSITVNKFESELNNYVYSDKLQIKQATAETATAETAKGNEAVKAGIEYANAINIVNSGSSIKIDGESTYTLKTDNNTADVGEETNNTDEHTIKFNVIPWDDSSYTVDYSSNANSMLVDNLLSIRVLTDRDVADATAEFVTDTGEIVISGQKTITDNESGDKIVVSAVAKLGSDKADKKDAIQSTINSVIDSAEIADNADDDKISINVSGLVVKTKLEDMNNFVLTSKVVEIENSETGDQVYCSPYSRGLTGSGLDKTVTIGSKSLKYGNISDSNTGYMPFILDSNIKIAAKSSDSLSAIFE